MLICCNNFLYKQLKLDPDLEKLLGSSQIRMTMLICNNRHRKSYRLYSDCITIKLFTYYNVSKYVNELVFYKRSENIK